MFKNAVQMRDSLGHKRPEGKRWSRRKWNRRLITFETRIRVVRQRTAFGRVLKEDAPRKGVSGFHQPKEKRGTRETDGDAQETRAIPYLKAGERRGGG